MEPASKAIDLDEDEQDLLSSIVSSVGNSGLQGSPHSSPENVLPAAKESSLREVEFKRKCLGVLGILLDNIIDHQDDAKYRTVNFLNSTIASTICADPPSLLLLQLLGFVGSSTTDSISSATTANDADFTGEASETVAPVDVIRLWLPQDTKMPDLAAIPCTPLPAECVVRLKFVSGHLHLCLAALPSSQTASVSASRSLALHPHGTKKLTTEQHREHQLSQLRELRAAAALARLNAASDDTQPGDKQSRPRNLTAEETRDTLSREHSSCLSTESLVIHDHTRMEQRQKLLTTPTVSHVSSSNSRRGGLTFSGFRKSWDHRRTGYEQEQTPGTELYYAEAYRRTRGLRGEGVSGLSNRSDGRPASMTIGDLRTQDFDPEYVGRQCLDRTNMYRHSLGLPSLFWSESLMKLGEEHSKNMGDGRVGVGHDGAGERFKRYGFRSVKSAENVATVAGAYKVAEIAVDGWIKSPGHEKNLRGEFTVCGVGVYRNPAGGFFLTQLFGAHGF
eukprot:GHVQ01001978.1.p1 GENE.GHVQ01001978.1~~GHVQ01001978.1.p1  ORF type:complete len:505 (+),score=53.49 GHVQ01001978.1:324-1838(+)